jgi:hypothetical protein
MFSTMYAWGNRPLQAFAVRPDVRRELEIPSALQEMARTYYVTGALLSRWRWPHRMLINVSRSTAVS